MIRTVRALPTMLKIGLAVPQILLTQADEVIE